MIHDFPRLEQADLLVLALIHDQRQALRYQVSHGPLRWTGFLRRNAFARAVQGSNSIEGYTANLADAIEIIDDERPDNVEAETQAALTGYRNAMTYILRIHDDPHAGVTLDLIRSLHFMMLSYDMGKYPGQWRPGAVIVVREVDGEVMYEAPDAMLVPSLMDEFARQLNTGTDQDAMVRGAMAHLNLTMIHPFKDGNGRMARALQTLLLTRDGLLSPVFCSIEEWLGRNTQAYYDMLAGISGGRWSPGADALPWVRFCLRAHHQQAATILRRGAEVSRMLEEVERLRRKLGLPERTESALMDAAFGYKVRNARYRAEHGLSEVSASRDLRLLCDKGLLVPVGEKRGRYYLAGSELMETRTRTRSSPRLDDPYALVRALDR